MRQQSVVDSVVYELVAGAIYGAVGAGILTAFGFTALSIPSIAICGALGCMMNAFMQDALPFVMKGRWYSDPSADEVKRDLLSISADIALRTAVVFFGCVFFNVGKICALGAIATEVVIEVVRAADSFFSSRTPPIQQTKQSSGFELPLSI